MNQADPYLNNSQDTTPRTIKDIPLFPFTPVLANKDHSAASEVEEMNDDFVKQAGLPSTTSDQA